MCCVAARKERLANVGFWMMLQELRWEDYSEGRKSKGAGGAAPGGFGATPAPAASGFGFGATTAQPSAFGGGGLVAAKPTGFGSSFGTPAATTSTFGAAAPAATTGFGGFGSTSTAPGIPLWRM